MQVTRVAPGRPVPSLMHRRRVMADRITYVGLDVHKESIVVAVASGGLRGEVREYGRAGELTAVWVPDPPQPVEARREGATLREEGQIPTGPQFSEPVRAKAERTGSR